MYPKNNLEVVRGELGLSNRDFADRLGLHETYYSKLKAGSVNPGASTRRKIQDGLPSINLNWLLENQGERNRDVSSVTAVATFAIPLEVEVQKLKTEIIQKDRIIALQEEMIQMLKKRVEKFESDIPPYRL